MTIAQLKYALALRKYGSFKNAAKKMSLTQPGLSLQIQKLEQEIGVVLFDRSAQPIELTMEGETFLASAEDIVAGFDILQASTAELNSGYKGKLVVGIIPTLAPFLVPLFVENLQKDYPDFLLDIHELTTEDTVAGVRSGELDVGLISTPLHVSGIRTKELFYERFYFYTSKMQRESSFSLETIDYKKLWLLNEGNCFRDQVNNFCDLKKIRRNKDFIYRSNSIDALIRIVDTRGGMTIMPELTTLSLNEYQEENIVPISKKAREISIIMRVASNKDHFIDKMGDYIQKNIPHHMLSSKGLEVVDPEIRI